MANVAAMRLSLVLAMASIVCTRGVYAQDIGLAEPSAPTKSLMVAIKTRPLNYVLYPLTGGLVIPVNLEVEAGWDNETAVALGIQYYGFDASLANGLLSATAKGYQLSTRVDLKRYFKFSSDRSVNNDGFFTGPYVKIDYYEFKVYTFFIPLTDRGYGGAVGGLFGYQHRFDRLLLNTHIGLGLGMIDFGSAIGFDGRFGLGIGYIIKKLEE